MRQLLLFFSTVSIPLVAATISGFKLPATDGKTYDLDAALKSNKAAAIVFVATKCPYSNAYNERYNRIAKQLSDLKVAFLPINSNDTESMDDVKAHSKE